MQREGAYPLLLEARSFLELGPSWAVLCGAVAARGLGLGLEAVLPFVLSVLLADALLGGIWSQSMTLAGSPLQGQSPPRRAPSLYPPYTLPGSVGHRVLSGVQRHWARWGNLPAELRDTWVGWGLAMCFALAVSVALGPAAALIASIALALLGVEFGRRRRGLPASWPLAVAQRGSIPWLVGYAALAGPFWSASGGLASTLASGLGAHVQALVWSGLYGLALYAHHHLERGQLEAGRRALGVAHGLGILALIAGGEPLLAGIVGLLYLPQGLWGTALRRGEGPAYRRRTQVYAMAVMLMGALSIAL